MLAGVTQQQSVHGEQQRRLGCKERARAGQGLPPSLSLGFSESALKDVHLALQGVVLLGGGARIQLQDEGGILLSQHISLVLCLSLPPRRAPAVLLVTAAAPSLTLK